MLYYYLCAIITLISSVVSFGFSIQSYLKARPQKDAALTNAKYAVSRSLSLLIAIVGALIFVSIPYLTALSIVMIGIQLFDGIIGRKISTFKTVGPIMTAAANAVVLVLLLIK